MTDSERPAFGATDVITLASKFEADDDAYIIGGQATNFWAWFFQEKAPEELKLKGPFTSEDIDYFGSQEIARQIASALDGQLLLPAQDDFNTASTAQIITHINGKLLKIDFLRQVLGIHDRELRRGVSTLEVEANIDGRGARALIKVLHPVQCFKSRIWSMLSPLTKRSDRIARMQAEASLVIVQCFIDDALDNSQEGWRDAHDCFRTLYWYLRSDECVKVADIKLGIDALTVLRRFAADERIETRYRSYQLRQMVANIERRRAGRRK